MQKLFSILFSFVILLQSFGANVIDITQMGDFIEHAQYHSEQYGDNVFVFISKHYGELKANHNKEHQEEKDEHEELPFQHQTQTALATAFVINLAYINYKTVEFLDLKSHNFYYHAPSSSKHLDGLLQPPRLS